jgi:hypothetical protein
VSYHINAIPSSAEPVLRVDTLFGSVETFPVANQPPPTAPPVEQAAPPPKPGDVLYQADWSQGMDGWAGTADWKTVAGLLVADGTAAGRKDLGWVWAGFQPGTSDYAVESDIKAVPTGGHFIPETNWGVLLRSAGSSSRNYQITCSCYYGGTLAQGTREANLAVISAQQEGQYIVSKAFTPRNDWHTYRLEAKGHHVRLLIDGQLIVETDDNRYLDGRGVGLRAAAQINVRSFKVIAL